MKGKKQMDRRAFLENMLSAYSLLGLRSLLLGVSPAFLSQRLMANDEGRKFLIFSSDRRGSPVNCNVPGTYIDGLEHPDSAAMAPRNFQLGNVNVRAAAPWASLPASLRSRLHFIHNMTQVNAHPEFIDVLYGHGKIKSASGSGQEMLASLVAQENAQYLGTILDKPLVLGSFLQYKGMTVDRVSPELFQSLFGSQPNAQVAQMMKFRDQAVDSLYSELKETGTPYQKEFLESSMNSRTQARILSEKLSETLGTIPQNDQEAQILVAAAACASGAAPVINIELRFGGDNHGDRGLTAEATQTVQSVAHMGMLHNHLIEFGVADKVTFALQNVFGRQFALNGKGGRNHNNSHSVSILFGSNIKPGVSGGVEKTNDNNGARAMGINSNSGRTNNPDINAGNTLVSSGKTILKACGIPDEVIEKRVQGGKVIKSVV